MTRVQLTTGIAVAAGLSVVAFFFIFNPSNMQSQQSTTTQSTNEGLVVQDQTVGTGEVAKVGDMVTVNYTGKFQDGRVFDTSIGRSGPPECPEGFCFILGAGQVIPGWDQGLQGMKVGGKRLLIIPPGLAYGANGMGPIPPNSTLIFEVDLLSVQSSGAVPPPEGAAAN